MAAIDGCHEKLKVPIIEERTCPQCGETVEVYTVSGRIRDDETCQCGYVFKADPPLTVKPRSEVEA
jgi:rubredoxin